MKYNKNLKSYLKLSFILTLGLSIGSTQLSFAKKVNSIEYTVKFDSIGNEIINGNRFLIHKIKPKENYYQLSRLYAVSLPDLKNSNGNKNLRVGDTVKIPRGKYIGSPEPQVAKQKSVDKNVLINPLDYTEYIVGKSETLYSISKRFNIKVEDIKRANKLTSNNIKEGLFLLIPKVSLPTESITTAAIEPKVLVIPDVIKENQPVDDDMFKPNKYGIHEKQERGIGLWLENLGGNEQTSLALHKTAPIGTILKITNPMNQNITFAKVVGKFSDNEETMGAIVVLSKSVAESIGLLDKKFQVELNYGIPLD